MPLAQNRPEDALRRLEPKVRRARRGGPFAPLTRRQQRLAHGALMQEFDSMAGTVGGSPRR